MTRQRATINNLTTIGDSFPAEHPRHAPRVATAKLSYIAHVAKRSVTRGLQNNLKLIQQPYECTASVLKKVATGRTTITVIDVTVTSMTFRFRRILYGAHISTTIQRQVYLELLAVNATLKVQFVSLLRTTTESYSETDHGHRAFYGDLAGKKVYIGECITNIPYSRKTTKFTQCTSVCTR